MNFDKELRGIIQDEIQSAIAPLARAIEELQANDDVASRLRALLGGAAAGAGRRVVKAVRATRKTRGKAGRPRGDARGCAVIACKRPARSKGYCSAHYQKRRMLERTKRLPSDWKEDAAPGTVKDLVLPRGRAGAKALAEAKK